MNQSTLFCFCLLHDLVWLSIGLLHSFTTFDLEMKEISRRKLLSLWQLLRIIIIQMCRSLLNTEHSYCHYLKVVVVFKAFAVFWFCFRLIAIENITQLAEEACNWHDVVHTWNKRNKVKVTRTCLSVFKKQTGDGVKVVLPTACSGSYGPSGLLFCWSVSSEAFSSHTRSPHTPSQSATELVLLYKHN